MTEMAFSSKSKTRDHTKRIFGYLVVGYHSAEEVSRNMPSKEKWKGSLSNYKTKVLKIQPQNYLMMTNFSDI